MARAEKKVENRLDEQEVDVFVPKCRVVRQWKDRKKKVTVPLFPNYLFANVDEYDRMKVLQTNGIVRMITFAGEPAEMGEDEIDQLKITQHTPERLEVLSSARPPVGSEVKVEQGPLQGLKGVVREQRGQHELLLEIRTIRQVVKVQLDEAAVEVL